MPQAQVLVLLVERNRVRTAACVKLLEAVKVLENLLELDGRVRRFRHDDVDLLHELRLDDDGLRLELRRPAQNEVRLAHQLLLEQSELI